MRYLALLLLFVANTAFAADYIIPEQTSGTYRFRTYPGDTFDEAGVPTSARTASIGIVDSAGVLYGCGNIPTGVMYDATSPLDIDVTFAEPAAEGLNLRARGFAEFDCAGTFSTGDSVKFGLIFFLGPHPPHLVP